MGTFRLWSDEMEAMRAEAREVIAAGRGLMGLDARPSSDRPRDDQVAAARESMAVVTFPSPDAEARVIGGVPCRVFRPEGAPRAIYLHFHGGGMISGSAAVMDIPNQLTAKEHGVVVVSVEYRQAPEFPWPAGPDDGVAVARALLGAVGVELGSDRLLIGGESAGGYMAAIVLLRIRDELHAADRVLGANLVFGVYDWGRSPSQRGIRPTDGIDMLDPVGIEFFTECYLPGLTDDERRDPSISPAFADLRNLPPALMTVGTADHLLDDTLMLSARWAAAGSEVELLVLPDMPHGFMAVPCEMAKHWVKRTYQWFAARLDADG